MKKSIKGNIIVIIIASIILVGSLVYCAVYLRNQAEAEKLNDELREQHTTAETSETTAAATEATTAPTETETTTVTTEPAPLVIMDSMQPFVDRNPDTVGWITVGGTSIDNVVVQRPDDITNDYYLARDFDGNYSQPGTIYADFRDIVSDYSWNQSDNIILYGHNQANGTMFGTLSRYKITSKNTSKFDFYLQHPTFTFSNLYEEYTYKIIALFVVEALPEQTRDGVLFDYHNFIKFGKTKRTFEDFISNVEERSQIITGVDVQEGDKFMTLSTCSNEFEPSRFIVIGRRVRDGESPEVDTSKATLNPNPKEPDLNYIYSR